MNTGKPASARLNAPCFRLRHQCHNESIATEVILTGSASVDLLPAFESRLLKTKGPASILIDSLRTKRLVPGKTEIFRPRTLAAPHTSQVIFTNTGRIRRQARPCQTTTESGAALFSRRLALIYSASQQFVIFRKLLAQFMRTYFSKRLRRPAKKSLFPA